MSSKNTNMEMSIKNTNMEMSTAEQYTYKIGNEQ